MWIISEFQRRQISVFRPCQRLWLVSLRGASQVGRRRGTFGSSAGLKMTPEQNNLILAWEKLCWTASTSTYTLHTVHWKHWNIENTLHTYTRKWKLCIPHENYTGTLYTIHLYGHTIYRTIFSGCWSVFVRSHLTLPWHSTRRILICQRVWSKSS